MTRIDTEVDFMESKYYEYEYDLLKDNDFWGILINKLNENELKTLSKVAQNIKNKIYKKLPEDEAELVRKIYSSNINHFVLNNSKSAGFNNRAGTIIATGYNELVIGDYGAYIEFKPEQVSLNNIKSKWPGKPNRPVKYIWMETLDTEKTKVYWQQGHVSYADYKPGMYYASPADLYVGGESLVEGK